jgi:hypothetical protein
MPALHFDGRLESDQGACFIRVPPEVLAALGQLKRMPVKVSINGYTYRTTIAVYGGKSYLGVRREVLKAAGVAAGDPLTVGLEYDAQVRTVDPPKRCAPRSRRTPPALPPSTSSPTRARRSSSSG